MIRAKPERGEVVIYVQTGSFLFFEMSLILTLRQKGKVPEEQLSHPSQSTHAGPRGRNKEPPL